MAIVVTFSLGFFYLGFAQAEFSENGKKFYSIGNKRTEVKWATMDRGGNFQRKGKVSGEAQGQVPGCRLGHAPGRAGVVPTGILAARL